MSSQFATTRWSVVLQANDNEDSTVANAALAELCETYWYPVYCFVRKKLTDSNDVADVVQGFFLDLLEHSRLQLANQSRGRFRSFMLASVTNYIKNWHRDKSTLKRGGGRQTLSLDFEDANRRFQIQPTTAMTPERAFEHDWAMELINTCMERLRARYQQEGKGEFFDAVAKSLGGNKADHAEIADRLKMSQSAVRVGAFRLRQRLGETIRREIARTVDCSSDAQAELAELMQVIAGKQ